MRFSLGELLQATGGALEGGDAAEGMLFEGVGTDTRVSLTGQLFVALKGGRFDGHDYLSAATTQGATGLLIDHGAAPEGAVAVQVDDTLEALGRLARHARRKAGFRLGAITGSFGKTTTKEMAAAMLQSAGRDTLCTPGNFNNLIGLPLTLLGARGDETDAVVELGINVPGEMAQLSAICEPDVALITGVGAAHTEGLGSVEGVAAEKLAIAAGLGHGGKSGTLLLPFGDPLLSACSSERIRVSTFGWSPEADVVGSHWVDEGAVGSRFRVDDREIRVPWPGRHNADNALAAWALIRAMGTADAVGVEPLATLAADPLRGSLRDGPNGSRLVVDCYNANPRAMLAALAMLAELARREGGRRLVAVLGEMKELGALEERAHRELGRVAVAAGVSHLLLLGESTRWTAEAAVAAGLDDDAIEWFEGRDALAERLRALSQPGDWVLVKGSRAAALDQVVDAVAGVDPPPEGGQERDG